MDTPVAMKITCTPRASDAMGREATSLSLACGPAILYMQTGDLYSSAETMPFILEVVSRHFHVTPSGQLQIDLMLDLHDEDA